ncbi:spore gernimation protein [Brevibacillus fluminis]|uniref:Spore gernimation protein n=1 Tax=Brevibacillus fluminis TaxID=511487 RepID=A0A3M8DN22_9BACL|nr:GerAB/ArcD/ProY family transporter [Brevibacillus fluminis]RNB89490.1 spore gernimation protein [Brevibacillus fluminis]
MQQARDDKLAFSQVSIGMASFILGAGIVSLPRSAGEAAGTPDIWISVLLAGGIAILFGCVCAKLNQRFPGLTIYQFSSLLLGKPIGYLLNFVFITYWLIMAAYELRMQAEVIRHFLLDRTPIAFTSLCFLAISAYLVLGGINPIMRLSEIVFPITTIVIMGIMMLSLKSFDFNHFRPVLSDGITPVLKAVKPASLSYLGFETILVMGAVASEPKKLMRAVMIGMVFPIVIYSITLVMTVGTLSVDVVKTLTWPTIEVIRSIEIPGAFFSNFELFFIVVWTIQIFTTMVSGYYYASLGVSYMFKTELKYVQYGFFFVIYFLALYPEDLNEAFSLGDTVGNLSMFTAGAIPLLLLLISSIKGHGKNGKNNA